MNRTSGKRVRLRGRGGFTLIEIIFAMVILSIALAAVFSTFNSQHKSYVVQNAVAQMQENVRGGMLYMEDDLRNMATGQASNLTLTLPGSLFGFAGNVAVKSGLGVADGGSSGPDRIFLLSLQSGQTTLASNSGESVPVQADTDVESVEGWQAGDLVIVYNNDNASIVMVTGVQESPTRFNHHPLDNTIFGTNKLGVDYGVGASVARIRFSGYSVDSSIPEHPRLVRSYFDNNGLPASDIVADDIEDLQVKAGVCDRTTGIVTEYHYSDIVGDDAKLDNVCQIRIQLVGRTASPDPAWNEGPYYNSRYNRTGTPANDHYRRRPIEQVIYLRNSGATE